MILLRSGVSAIAITLGGWHTCVIVTGGGVKCWGYGPHLGFTVPSDYPVNVGIGSGAVLYNGRVRKREVYQSMLNILNLIRKFKSISEGSSVILWA